MKVLAPAKINLFLKIANKRKDGYHNIKTGITFINLYDEIFIKKSKNSKNSILYTGPFAPLNNRFKNDLVKKLLSFLFKDQKKKYYFDIVIKKNIPYGSGLGGSSVNAAGVFRGLKKLKINFKEVNQKKISLIGADIPMCISSRDCIAEGIGEKIDFNINYDKNYFLLVKPNFSLSTKGVYARFQFKDVRKNNRNDLQQTAIKIKPLLKTLLSDLSNLEGRIYSSMSGSGSCCYVAFKNFKDAKKSLKIIKSIYPDYWTSLANNKI